MKLTVRIILTLFLSLFGAGFLLQTPMAKNRVKGWLIDGAKAQGIELSIGSIEGNLPFEWSMKQVSCKWHAHHMTIGSAKVRLAVFPLMKKQIDITHLKLRKSQYNGIPLQAIARGRIELDKTKPIKISHCLIEGKELFIQMTGKIYPNGSFQEGNLSFHFPDLSIIEGSPFHGRVNGAAQITKKAAHLECNAEELSYKGISIGPSSLTMDAHKSLIGWDGLIRILGMDPKLAVEGKCAFTCNPTQQLISIDSLHIQGPETEIEGKIDFNSTFKSLQGVLSAHCGDLSLLRPLFPKSCLKGALEAQVHLHSFATFQDLGCHLKVKEGGNAIGSFEELSIDANLYDLFGERRGECLLSAKKGVLGQFHLNSLELTSTSDPNSSPFELKATGQYRGAVELVVAGYFDKLGRSGCSLHIEKLSGITLFKPFLLEKPVHVLYDDQGCSITPVMLQMGEGHMTGTLELNRVKSSFSVHAEEFPLELIPLPKNYLSLKGTGSIDLHLNGEENLLTGSGTIALKRAFFLSEGNQNSLSTKGSLQIHVNQNRAQVHTELKIEGGQFIHLNGTFPIDYEPYPLQIGANREQKMQAELVAEVRCEEICNFINIGHHRLEGWLATTLHVSKTLHDPSIHGIVELQGGLYENYYTGTCLKQLNGKGEIRKRVLHIYALQGIDGGKGKISAIGDVQLMPSEGVPFSITAKVEEFELISFDAIGGQFSGILNITGNQTGALVKGALKVEQATFRIPDQLPAVQPTLPITFINPPEVVTNRGITSPPTAPLKLELELHAPGNVRIEGRGLSCEVEGGLKITGTFTEIAASGRLQLVRGIYIFSGKVFNLTEGELIFNDTPTPSNYISFSGSSDLPDVHITAILRGPLATPKLTFQSSPQLPTSSLLARILFNKDISEISAVQGLQLAQTVIALSGSSAPDILGKIRKTLGIDRLTLVTSENDPTKLSLQIGKYLMRGVMLTLSQGTESRNICVEVELRKGIFFQAEVSEQLQRKFSLKWNHNY